MSYISRPSAVRGGSNSNCEGHRFSVMSTKSIVLTPFSRCCWWIALKAFGALRRSNFELLASFIYAHCGEALIYDESGASILHRAVAIGQSQLVAKLLELGADPWEENYAGMDPASMAGVSWSFGTIIPRCMPIFGSVCNGFSTDNNNLVLL